jgi:hypothetical protein
LAIRVFGENAARAAASKSARQIPDVLKANVIDATFTYNSTNQPIGGTSAYSKNFVIYAGRTPPFEIHERCVDIAVVRVGSGDIQIGGTVLNPKEETPGETRGDGVKGSRDQEIAVGDASSEECGPRSAATYAKTRLHPAESLDGMRTE